MTAMPPHERSRSRGSFSLLSLETIRSISRAGSRQATRIPSRDELQDRSESRMSCRCDPHNQPPASSGPDLTIDGAAEAPGSAPPESGHDRDADDKALGNGEIASGKGDGSRQRVQRSRRLSWLPFGRSSSRSQHSRSRSAHLPRATSSSTVARSVISGPILTSTTNSDVARVEGVFCQDKSGLAVSQTPLSTQVGRMVRTVESLTGRGNSRVQQGSTSAGDVGILPNSAGKKGRMLRLGHAVRSKLRGPPLLRRRHSEKALPLDRADDTDEGNIPTVESSIARRRTEAMNLYRGKIKGLTGNGHIRRKPVNNSKAPGAHHGVPLLSDLTDLLMGEEVADQDDSDSPFGSLTKSFASAVDKLDFSASLPYTIPFIRSRSSLFSAKKDKESSEGSEAKRQMSGASSTSRSPSAVLPSSSPSELVHDRSPTPALPGKSTPDKLASQTTPSTRLVFASEKNRYVLPTAIDGRLGHVNPLRMHPPFGMARAPSPPLRATQPIDDHQGTSPTAGTEAPGGESEDDHDSLSLEDAPIYSPSLGDLSQYSRDTPASKATYRSEPECSSDFDATPTPTPTKSTQAGGQQRGVLKKSKSGVGMFYRSKSVKISRPTNLKGAGSDHPSAATPSTPSTSDQPDINRDVTTGKDKMVKKSRSLHFGGLFKKASHSDLAAAIPRDLSVPFQPATPSPLRTVTRALGSVGKISSHVHDRRSISGL